MSGLDVFADSSSAHPSLKGMSVCGLDVDNIVGFEGKNYRLSLNERKNEMFEKLKGSAEIKKLEYQKHKLEKVAEKDRLQQEQIRADQKRAKQELKKIEEEKERLLSLDEKNLQVEMILAIRGFYQQFSDLKAMQTDLGERLDKVEASISSIESDISSLESEIRNVSARVD